MTNSQVRQLCNQLRACFNATEQFVRCVEFDTHDPRQIVLVLYAARTLDNLSGVITTFMRKEYTSVPVLTRASIESFAWFLYITKYENSQQIICLHDLYGKVKRLRQDPDAFAQIRRSNVDEVQSYIKRHESNIEKFSDYEDEYKKTCKNIHNLFVSVGMKGIYRTVYARLSASVHSMLSAVEEGSLNVNSLFLSVSRCKCIDSQTLMCLGVFLGLLEDVPNQLNIFLKLDRNVDLERIRKEIQKAENTRVQFVNNVPLKE